MVQSLLAISSTACPWPFFKAGIKITFVPLMTLIHPHPLQYKLLSLYVSFFHTRVTDTATDWFSGAAGIPASGVWVVAVPVSLPVGPETVFCPQALLTGFNRYGPDLNTPQWFPSLWNFRDGCILFQILYLFVRILNLCSEEKFQNTRGAHCPSTCPCSPTHPASHNYPALR